MWWNVMKQREKNVSNKLFQKFFRHNCCGNIWFVWAICIAVHKVVQKNHQWTKVFAKFEIKHFMHFVIQIQHRDERCVWFHLFKLHKIKNNVKILYLQTIKLILMQSNIDHPPKFHSQIKIRSEYKSILLIEKWFWIWFDS